MRYTETELSGAAFDQPNHYSPPAKIFICTSPRSGSYLLCRLMISAGFGIPHEYFNPLHVKVIGKRLVSAEPHLAEKMLEDPHLLKQYLDALSQRRTRHGIFAAKIQYWQYHKYLDNQIGDQFPTNAKFVYLYRKDLLGQAISLHFAQLTGQWGFDSTVTTTPAEAPNFGDLSAIERELDNICAEDHRWRGFFARNGIEPFVLSHEELCTSQISSLQSLVRWLGVAANINVADIDEEEKYSSKTGDRPDKSEVRKQYLASRQRIRASQGGASGGPEPVHGKLPTIGPPSVVGKHTEARRVVFIGDCQAAALAHVYRDFVAPLTEDTVTFLSVDSEATREDGGGVKETDIVVSQLFNTPRKLTADAIDIGARRVEFPSLFIGFLWPFAGQAAHIRNPTEPRLQPGPYPAQLGDTFLNRLIAEGAPAEEALRRYLDLDMARVGHLDRLMELHLSAQASRDEKTGFGFSRIIEARFRHTCLFLTPHHPTLTLMVPLIWGVFERLGVPPLVIEAAVQALRTTPFPKHALPIHPAVIRHFGLRFVDENSRFPYNEEGSFTFAEYVIRYMGFIWNEHLADGMALVHGSDLPRAEAALCRGLALSPQSAEGWRSMALVLRRMHRFENARDAAARAITLDTEDPANHIELARILIAMGDLAAAEVTARTAVEIASTSGASTAEAAFAPGAKFRKFDPGVNSAVHHVLAEIHMRQGRRDEALLSSKRAVTLRPGDRRLHALLGHILGEKNDFDAAEAAFRQAFEADPMLDGYRFSFAQVLFRQGKDDEAFELLRTAELEDNLHALALSGHILARKNDLLGAEAAFERALQFDPSFEPVRDALANVRARIAGRLAAESPEYAMAHAE